MINLNVDGLKGIPARVLLTPEEAAKVIFGGCRSAASLRRDANKHRLPFIKFGRRIYFDAEVVQDFIKKSAEESIQAIEKFSKKDVPAETTVPGITTIGI
ncbi:MAG: helix-turn-helix domain-containing protein [Anaerovibrio sp.]